MKIRYILVLFVLALIVACQPKIEEFPVDKGTADFTTYVAIGNSLTAGYADRALYREGQINSFPNMLANQLKTVGMQGEFTQPLMPAGNGVGIASATTFNTKYVLGMVTDCLNTTSLGPRPAELTPDQGALATALLTPVTGPFRNLGVPGAKVAHLLYDSYGDPTATIGGIPSFNPYYVRFAPSTSTSVVAAALAQSPTFFTSWIGNNDVLIHATTGAADPNSPLTDATAFLGTMDALLGAMTTGGAKGAIANIPDVTTIPFFTTVPYNALVLTEEIQVAQLNAAYAALNVARVGLGLDPIEFALGPNALIIADAAAPGGLRQIKSTELILLTVPQDDIKCAGLGSATAIPDQYVLTETEIDAIQTAIDDYNGSILAMATKYDLAHVDVNKILKDLNTGLIFDGLTFTPTFVTGGTFSLDGVHLNPRGYAVIANAFIDAINAKFGASVPKVNITDYEGVVFP